MAQLILEPGEHLIEVVRKNVNSETGAISLTPAFCIGIDANNFAEMTIGMGVNGFVFGKRPDGSGGLHITHNHLYAETMLGLPIQPDGSAHIKGNDGKVYSIALTEVLP